ncbi:MAG: hypothetical protein KAJ42_00185, partial [Gemmatimonadetes bacterium]|nr:hypothetical protein [Gemmatimonadota bacterium]
MPQSGTILIGGAAAVLALLALRRRRPVAASSGILCDPGPYKYNQVQVLQRIDGYLDSGRRDPASITLDVATDLFSPHPSGADVVFPPVINPQQNLPLPGVQCVFELVGRDTLKRMEERGITPGVDDDNTPVTFGNGDADMPGYPWDTPFIQKDNYPTPGMFFLVGQPTKVGSDEFVIQSDSRLVRAALGSAMAMAGNYKGEWVKSPPAGAGPSHPYFNSNAKRLRSQMAKLIRYSPWNDELYGQTNANYAGGNDPSKPGGDSSKQTSTYMMEPCMRGLNWLPRHADNIGRLAQGLAPKRTTTLSGEKLTGDNAG